MKNLRRIMVMLAFSGLSFAAPAHAQKAHPTKRHRAESNAAEAQPECDACEAVRRLEEKVEAQQVEIDALKAALQSQAPATRDEKAAAAAAAAEQQAAAAAEAAAQANATAQSAKADVANLKSESAVESQAVQDTRKQVSELQHPASMRYKGITFTPGGFLSADMLWRQRAQYSDANSTYNGLPFPSNSSYHLTEYRGTARQSRLTFLAAGKTGNLGLKGYFEMDFQSAAPTANENQTNSFNPRQRQLFAEASGGSWSILGGQAWSLITTNRAGISPWAVWNPVQIDANYVVGYSYVRQMGMRVTKSFGDGHTTVAFAVENPASLQVSTAGNVINGGAGTVQLGNGRNYSANVAPDMIAKIVFDPGFGHFELKGIGRFFRDRYVPTHSNNTVATGGVGAAAIVPVLHKRVKLIAEAMVGNAIGRYADSGTVDVSLRSNGEIEPLWNLHGMAGIETSVSPKLDWYIYGGQEYQDRDATGSGGFGDPLVDLSNTNCVGPDTNLACKPAMKSLAQGMTGFWYTLYKGDYGAVKYGMQYSYTHYSGWRDSTGVAPSTGESMAFSSFRYFLP